MRIEPPSKYLGNFEGAWACAFKEPTPSNTANIRPQAALSFLSVLIILFWHFKCVVRFRICCLFNSFRFSL